MTTHEIRMDPALRATLIAAGYKYGVVLIDDTKSIKTVGAVDTISRVPFDCEKVVETLNKTYGYTAFAVQEL